MSDEELRMTAYYYGFYDTGVREIDLILSAVACAGKAFHHTQDWNDDCTWIGHEGDTPEAWIQNAGRKAADEIEHLRAELAALCARKPIVYSPDAQAMSDRVKAAEAERDALRALLREALAHLKTGQWTVPTDITLMSRIEAALNKGGE